MKPEDRTLRFFLGANTPQGFVSRFDQLADVDDGWRTLVIKGGPGCGKSTMMKKLAAKLQKNGEGIEIIHCSSDVDSVDGVIAPARKLAIVDGTPPHEKAAIITIENPVNLRVGRDCSLYLDT